MLSVLFLFAHLLFSSGHGPAHPPVNTAVRGYASGLIGSASPTLPRTVPVMDADAPLTPEETALLHLVNDDRAAQGLTALTLDARLTAIARAHSQDMDARRYFDHAAPGPGPSTPMERFLAVLGYRPDYAMVGENIYYRSMTDDPARSSDQAETAFMNSPGHRANILQPRYAKIGIGFWRDSETGQFWVTEMFLCDRE